MIREPKWSISWSSFCKQKKKKEHAYAVEPPVTSPLYNGHFFGPGRQSIHWLLYNPLYNGHLKGNGHYCFNKSVSPTAKLTSQQRPVFSAANEQVNNGHSEICFVRRVDDLSWQSYLDCVIYSAAVRKHELSTTLTANVVNFVRFVPLTFWLFLTRFLTLS